MKRHLVTTIKQWQADDFLSFHSDVMSIEMYASVLLRVMAINELVIEDFTYEYAPVFNVQIIY